MSDRNIDRKNNRDYKEVLEIACLSEIPMSDNPNYELAQLFPVKNRTLDKRWYLKFSAFDSDTGTVVPKIVWLPASLKKTKERLDWANEQIKLINKALILGHTFKSKKKKKENGHNLTQKSTLIEALTFAANIKKIEAEKIFSKNAEDRGKRKGHNTARTYNSCKNIVADWLFYQKINEITLYDFTYDDDGEFSQSYAYAFRDYLLFVRDNSNKTANNQLNFLTGLINELVKRKIARHNPAAKIPPLKTSIGNNIAFNKEEKRLLIKVVKERDKELYFFICFIYYGMLRPDEVRFLKVKDIKDDKIFVDEVLSKNNNSEHVVIPEHFQSILDEHAIRKMPSENYVFHNPKSPVGQSTFYAEHHFYNRFLKILQEFGLDNKHTLYSWRHTATIDLHNERVPIDYIRKQLRHKSLETTIIYLKSLGVFENNEIKNNFPKL